MTRLVFVELFAEAREVDVSPPVKPVVWFVEAREYFHLFFNSLPAWVGRIDPALVLDRLIPKPSPTSIKDREFG